MKRTLRCVPLSMLFFVVAIGAIHAWAARHSMNPDGIAYLEVGEAYLRGDWGSALNAYWSPAYAVILAIANRVAMPTAYWEFTVVHVVNFVIYLFAFFSFVYMLSGFLELTADSMGEHRQAFVVFAISLFLITSLNLITLAVVTPDMLLSAFLYLACAVVLKMALPQYAWIYPVALGVVLGLGYLTKAPFFLIALFFVVISYGVSRSVRKAVIVGVCFLLLSLPYLFVLSGKEERPTFGESGRLNFIWYTNDVKEHIHWQGGGHNGRPTHPTRQIYETPNAFEFREPISATYAPWYDPVYWNDGLIWHFDLGGIMANIMRNAREYYFLFFTYYGAVIIGVLFLFFLHERPRESIARASALVWPILSIALAGLGMYLMGVVRGRYTAPFILLFLLALAFGASVTTRRRGVRGALYAMTLILLMIVFGSSVSDLTRIVRANDPTSHVQWQVANLLHQKGIDEGSRIAYIGHNFNGLAAFWAYLGRLRIIAEVPSGEDSFFWRGSNELRGSVLTVLERTGARAVVTEYLPHDANVSRGWERLGGTDYGLYIFR